VNYDDGNQRAQLLRTLGQTLRDDDYAMVVQEMRKLLQGSGDVRGMATLDWYLDPNRVPKDLLARLPVRDRARTSLALAERAERERDANRAQRHFAEAATLYENAGFIARAAICREKANDPAQAGVLYSRLSQVLLGSESESYAAALARFNVARMLKLTGQTASAREALVSAVHLLEQAADTFETIGQRERAFDCFQVLIAVGKESKEFEHVLEGYVNVIRILREDNLRHYAIQSYEEVVQAAEKQGELAAAATLAREMATYARTQGLANVANQAVLNQAKLWQDVASSSISRGSPPEIAENAILAAVLAYGEAGQFGKVGLLYRQLATLELSEARRGHYARAQMRYGTATDLAIDASPLPSHLRHEVGFPEVWHVDLVEWEQRGSATEACADVVLDPAWGDASRRKALCARLVAIGVDSHEEARQQPPSALLSHVAGLLGEIRLYSILAPLEALARHQDPAVRVSAMRALAQFLFKRTFIAVRDGLADSNDHVVNEAARTLEVLHFAPALDPLVRIFQESSDARARQGALRALVRIDSAEAASFLLDVLAHERNVERRIAVEALKTASGSRFIDAARQRFPRMTDDEKNTLREVFRARGIPL
jgi:tetratricopeptide (TPR) repeat protein